METQPAEVIQLSTHQVESFVTLTKSSFYFIVTFFASENVNKF